MYMYILVVQMYESPYHTVMTLIGWTLVGGSQH